MANGGSKIRDIFIGLILIVVGGATLLHTLHIFVFDEARTVLAADYVLLGLGAVLLISYFFSPKNIWLLILALCLVFIAATSWILTFRPGQSDLVAVAFFLLISLAYFVYFIVRPSTWWALLVGWICLGLAGVVYSTMSIIAIPFLPDLPGYALQPLILFTGVGLGFLSVWLTSPRGRWWALLTAGMIAAVESTILLDSLNRGERYIAIFLFLISGITFLLVWLLRTEENRLQWAIYPASVLISIAAFFYLVTILLQNTSLALSIIFIVLGCLFIANYFISLMRYRKKAEAVAATPAAEAQAAVAGDIWETGEPEAEEPSPPEEKPLALEGDLTSELITEEPEPAEDLIVVEPEPAEDMIVVEPEPAETKVEEEEELKIITEPEEPQESTAPEEKEEAAEESPPEEAGKEEPFYDDEKVEKPKKDKKKKEKKKKEKKKKKK